MILKPKQIIVLLTVLVFMAGMVFGFNGVKNGDEEIEINWGVAPALADDDDDDDDDDEEGEEEEVSEEDKEKAEEAEEEIDELEEELEDVEKEKLKHEQQKVGIVNQLAGINNNISTVQTKLSKTEEEMERISEEIKVSEERLNEKKKLLANVLREVNQSELEMNLTLMGQDYGWGEYFTVMDNLESLKEELVQVAQDVKKEKENQEDRYGEQQKVFAQHDSQKKELQSEKNKKTYVLGQTQEKINKKDLEIGQIRSKINNLRADIAGFLGKNYTAKDIEDAAKYSAKVTGTRRDFIMGMLVVESDLGRYTGGCTYKEVEDGAKKAYKKGRLSSRAYSTFKKRRETFKDICDDLDYDYKKRKVSCNPSSYAGTGGAMGVAQFMPDTWMGYKSSISSVTGHNPPDPWDLTDGVVAMGLKLAKVPGVTSHKKSAERNASKLYLSGTTSSKYDWYADKVQYWADNYEKLL